MKTLARWFVVVAALTMMGCFSSGKHGPRGTNVGSGSDSDGPWTQGAPTQAAR